MHMTHALQLHAASRSQVETQNHAPHHCARRLAHLVYAGALSLPVHVLCVQLVVDGNIEIAVILLARLVLEDTGDGLILLHGQNVLQVENSLLPVGVLCVGAGGELDGLVAARELDVEPGDQGVDEVAATDLDLVR